MKKEAIVNLLKRNRTQINMELDFLSRRYFSPAIYSGSFVTIPQIKKYVRGKCIDIGCGDSPLKDLMAELTDQYDTLDIEKRGPNLTYLSDICNMEIVENDAYDSAICLEVLEHVPDPFKAVTEINRILKKEGILVCSVPHLSRLHEEPHDYYRYTKHGLEYLFKNSGFNIISISPTGGLFCFLGHQISSVLLLPV